MTLDDQRGQHEEGEEHALDASLKLVFQAVEAPEPPAGFVARTLQAVRREPLPPERHRLRHPWSAAAGWAALVVGVVGAAYAVAMSQPLLTWAFASLLTGGIRVGVWATQFAGTGLALADLFATTGLAIARAVATREGSTGLMLAAVVCALSLSALRRLLGSEGEVSQW